MNARICLAFICAANAACLLRPGDDYTCLTNADCLLAPGTTCAPSTQRCVPDGENDDGSTTSSGGGGSSGGSSGTVTHREWANWPAPPESPSSFTQNTESVTDNNTGLTWQHITAQDFRSWSSANDECQGLDLEGQTDWRLPTLIELVSIADLRRSHPAIDLADFPSTPSERFWTSSIYVPAPAEHWIVHFDSGYTYRGEFSTHAFRCVRGGSFMTGPRYTTDATTVLDNATGLAWQRAPLSGSMTFSEASSACNSFGRLPNLHELETLLDVTRSAPAIDEAAFPDTPAVLFWSSTSDVGQPGMRWALSFADGASAGLPPTSPFHVRCVR